MTTNENPEVPVLWTVGLFGSGEPITDLATATEAVAVIFGRTDLEVQEDGVDGWLVQLPEAQAAELAESGWLELEVGNWELEAELP